MANVIEDSEENPGIPTSEYIPTLFFSTEAENPYEWFNPTCVPCDYQHNEDNCFEICSSLPETDCAPAFHVTNADTQGLYAWLTENPKPEEDKSYDFLSDANKDGAVKVSIPTRTKGKHSIRTYDFVHKHRCEHKYNHNYVDYKELKTYEKHEPRKASVKTVFPAGFKTVNDNDLIWDSGASHSIVSTTNNLKEKQPPPFKQIKGLSGQTAEVAAVGKYNQIDGVLAVPNASQDLLSVGSFLDQKGGELIFTSQTVLYVPSYSRTKQPTKIGERREDGLYNVSQNALRIKSASVNLSKAEQDFQLLRERVHMLHRLLGHVGKPKMKAILSKYNLVGLKPHHVDLMTYCEACKVGSAKFKSKNKVSENRARKFGERVMSDNSGRLRTRSTNGSYYACVVVDDYSSWIWLKGLHTISRTCCFLQHVIEVELHQRNDHRIQFFRSDVVI